MLDNRGLVFIQGINEDDGGSNGSGKSSFINAIKEILFAQNDTGKSKANVINKHEDWDNGMFGVLWLKDRRNIEWRIIVARKWKWKDEYDGMFGLAAPGSTHPYNSQAANSSVRSNGDQYEGTDIFLERWDGDSYTWVDERPTSTGNKTFEDTQKKIIDEIVGMTYDQFSAYVCLGQKAESALVNGTSGSREKIIQSVADVTVWTKAAEIIKTTQSNREIDLNNFKQKLSGMQSVYTAIGDNAAKINETKHLISQAEQIVENNNASIANLNAALMSYNMKIAEDDVSGIPDELDILKAEERHAVERLQKAELPARPQELIDVEEEVGKLNYDLMTLRNSIENFERLGTGECGTCGQVITGKYVKDEIKALKQELKSTESVHKTKLARQEELRNEYNKNVENVKLENTNKHNHEMQGIEESRSRLVARQQVHNDLQMKITNLENEHANILSMQSVQNQHIASLKSTLQTLEGEDNRKQQIEKEMSVIQSTITQIEEEIKHMKWTEKNLKKLRIQEYNSVIERLNILLSEELYELWGPRLSVRFVTASAKTRGSGVKQGLDLMVSTPKKTGIPSEMYCGGETKAIVVAMFKSMIRLSIERGVAVNLSAIDEIDKDLDDQKTDRLVEAYQSIVDQSSTCFVISHNSRLINTLRPNETWIVRKKDEMATIEIPNPYEAAA